jgi:hypothetical protein
MTRHPIGRGDAGGGILEAREIGLAERPAARFDDGRRSAHPSRGPLRRSRYRMRPPWQQHDRDQPEDRNRVMFVSVQRLGTRADSNLRLLPRQA